MNAPIDHTHQESVLLIAAIRRRVSRARAYVARWEPRPYPGEGNRADS